MSAQDGRHDEEFRRYTLKSFGASIVTGTVALRLRLANSLTEFNPVKTMNGHKTVQIITHNARPPVVEASSGVLAC